VGSAKTAIGNGPKWMRNRPHPRVGTSQPSVHLDRKKVTWIAPTVEMKKRAVKKKSETVQTPRKMQWGGG